MSALLQPAYLYKARIACMHPPHIPADKVHTHTHNLKHLKLTKQEQTKIL